MVVAVLVIAILLYWPGMVSLHELWTDTRGETYTSGYMIAALSVWLLWRNRVGLVPTLLPQAWRAAGLLALAAGALLWAFALRAGIQIIYLTMLPPLWWLCVLLTCGWRAARAAAFPLGFLVFALPVWDYAIPMLQWLTVHVVRVALRITGVPSYFTGEMVQIPSGLFEIQGGCSGLHYLIVGLAVAVLLGQLRRDGWPQRLHWVLVAAVLGVASNWLRVYSIILAGHLSHMQSYLVRVSHYSYGWFVFVATLVVFFLYVRWRAPPLRVAAATRPGAPGERVSPAWLVLVAAVAAVPAALGLVINARLPADPGRLLASAPPTLSGGWSAVAAESGWQPVQKGADVVRRWKFVRGAEIIELYAAGYQEQRQRRKLGGRANVPGGLEASVLDEARVEAGNRVFASQLLEQDGALASLWRGYQVDDHWFASATRAQFWYSARTLLTLRSPPSRVWMLRTACETDCEAAGQRLGRFVELNGEILWPDSPPESH